MNNNLTDGRYRGKIKGLVADWAGTTIDFGSRAPANVFVEIFRRRGVTITQEEARGPMGMSKREHIAALIQLDSVTEEWKSQHERLPVESDIDEMYEQFLPLQKETLASFCEMIPGAVDTINQCRDRGIAIGSSTGYTRALMDVVEPAAKEQGYEPDAVLCADDVPTGRPAPWLIYLAAMKMNVYPMAAIVKIDDTTVGIEAGRNAGTWTVGVSATGNQIGLSLQEYEALSVDERNARLSVARERYEAVGAHYVIDSIAELMPVIDEIETRLKAGESP